MTEKNIKPMELTRVERFDFKIDDKEWVGVDIGERICFYSKNEAHPHFRLAIRELLRQKRWLEGQVVVLGEMNKLQFDQIRKLKKKLERMKSAKGQKGRKGPKGQK